MGSPRRVFIVDVAAGHKVVGTIPYSKSVRPPALSADEKRHFQNVDGILGFEVSDVVPQIARVTDKLALVRSMTHADSDHQRNFKSQLQQHAQKFFSSTPGYELLDEQGSRDSRTTWSVRDSFRMRSKSTKYSISEPTTPPKYSGKPTSTARVFDGLRDAGRH